MKKSELQQLISDVLQNSNIVDIDYHSAMIVQKLLSHGIVAISNAKTEKVESGEISIRFDWENENE